jgi:transposase InsO family protein
VLVELGVVEQRYQAVLEVLDEGVPVTVVARRYGVARQTVHEWLSRYANEGGLGALADRSSRPASCPHQMPAVVEARIVALRREHPGWGPSRIAWQLEREGTEPLPGRSSVYRALVRHGLVEARRRRRRREDYRRRERGRAMELWQMDVMGRVFLAGGQEVKIVTGIDDHSRFLVCARVVVRATARPVCQALAEALRRHGVPGQILTDNGKVFTGRFGTGPGPVMFDRICADNGIRHLLTAPYSPTTTGKIERVHKTMRAEFFTPRDRQFATVPELQAALDGWVLEYNTARPHQSCGGRPPAERFRLADRSLAADDSAVTPPPVPAAAAGKRPAGVSRWVNAHGRISLAGYSYAVGATYAGEPVEVVVARGLVDILHAGVVVAAHAQRLRDDQKDRAPRARVARRARDATAGLTVTRLADGSGNVSFAGTTYACGRSWARTAIDVSIVAGSVQLARDGKVIRVHPIRHDRARELGAIANPKAGPGARTPPPAMSPSYRNPSVAQEPELDTSAVLGGIWETIFSLPPGDAPVGLTRRVLRARGGWRLLRPPGIPVGSQQLVKQGNRRAGRYGRPGPQGFLPACLERCLQVLPHPLGSMCVQTAHAGHFVAQAARRIC